MHAAPPQVACETDLDRKAVRRYVQAAEDAEIGGLDVQRPSASAAYTRMATPPPQVS